MRISVKRRAANEPHAGLSDKPGLPGASCSSPRKKVAVVLRLHGESEPVRLADSIVEAQPHSDKLCCLCEKLVCLKLDIPLKAMRSKTRSCADVALARQIAMYLAHTTFSVMMTEVGLHFNRDRTTVRHACSTVEDRRDDLAFDTMICQLEDLLKQVIETSETSGTPFTEAVGMIQQESSCECD